MQKARMLGNYIQQLADEQEIAIPELGALLGCTEYQVEALMKGRYFVSFPQLSKLANKFGVTVNDLLAGNSEHYNKTVVHCMNQFRNTENREFILDIIDDYLDIAEAVK